MKTRLVLKPGQRGTRRFLKQYGEALGACTYVMTPSWDSASRDLEKRSQVKAAGGRWRPDEGLWYVRYGNIAGSVLEMHIQLELFGPGRERKSI